MEMQCDICYKVIKREDGYLLTTSQVVFSERYWKFIYDLFESSASPISVQQLEK
jgi:hypothetical protein